MSQIPVNEEFYSVQGEGYHAGKAAYFIRIGGCDIGCSWCDSKSAWEAEPHTMIDVEEIVNHVLRHSAKAVVITGGEPLIHNLEDLCTHLKANNIETFIETSGAYPVSGSWTWICLSPKKNFPPQPDIFPLANELKVIIQTEEDFKWAEENALKVKSECKLFLQPEWSRFKTITPIIVEYVKRNPQWNISVQIHKFMRIP